MDPVRVKCCDKLDDTIREDAVMTEVTHPRPDLPQDIRRSSRGVYLMSDGGHGGWERANFCPFCGAAIKYERPATGVVARIRPLGLPPQYLEGA